MEKTILLTQENKSGKIKGTGKRKKEKEKDK